MNLTKSQVEALHAQIAEECSNTIPRLEGWCTAEKGSILADLVLERRPGLIVESGIFGGRSLVCLALAARLNGSGICVGIDPWTIDAALEGGLDKDQEEWWQNNMKLEDIYAGFVKSVVRLELLKQCRWIRSKSEDAAKIFRDGTINLFHQDSNHTELVSCKEVRTWQRKIAPGGLWIMDDSNWPTQATAIRMIQELNFKLILTKTHGEKQDQQFMVFERQ